MTDTATLKMAAKLAQRYWGHYQDYLEEVESDHRDGFAAHYCEHGMNLWTDYDPICGKCEDGWSMKNGVHRRRRALDEAHSRMERATEMSRVLGKAVDVLGPHAVNTDEVMKRIAELLTV